MKNKILIDKEDSGKAKEILHEHGIITYNESSFYFDSKTAILTISACSLIAVIITILNSL